MSAQCAWKFKVLLIYEHVVFCLDLIFLFTLVSNLIWACCWTYRWILFWLISLLNCVLFLYIVSILQCRNSNLACALHTLFFSELEWNSHQVDSTFSWIYGSFASCGDDCLGVSIQIIVVLIGMNEFCESARKKVQLKRL